MRRRDFVRGLGLLGISAAVADRLAFMQGLGRVFPSAMPPVLEWSAVHVGDRGAAFGPALYLAGQNMVLGENNEVIEWRPVSGDGPTWYGGLNGPSVYVVGAGRTLPPDFSHL